MRIRWIVLAGFFSLFLIWMAIQSTARSFSVSRDEIGVLPRGNVDVPEIRTLAWEAQSQLNASILEHWAKTPLPDWKTHGKTRAPRALMGRFVLGRDIEEANAYLMSARPWGRSGSTWNLHSEGDYDFTLAALAPILFQFGDDPTRLYPETVNHLVNVLLTEEGGKPQVAVPRTLGLVEDTENHLLMTEGSRYLKNRWMQLQGSRQSKYDNVTNGLEAWLLNHLTGLGETGFYEFNSIPYEGYTLTALLNLEAFGSAEIQAAARKLLDRLNWDYAVGSLGFRQFAPFRRQRRHAADTALDGDYHTALMKSWLSLSAESPPDLRVDAGGLHHALWACWSSYRLPDRVAQWTLKKPRDYFVCLGHGPKSSPEIYSGGPGYLLTAGGVARGKSSLVVARPTTLLLDDDASTLSELVHLAGPGENHDGWNNTGLWKRFAVAAGPVHIPEDWEANASESCWTVYQRKHGLCISVFTSPQLGIVHLSTSTDPQSVLSAITSSNQISDLWRRFITPQGIQIEYDLNAASDCWVIKRVNQSPVDRAIDQWPLMEEL